MMRSTYSSSMVKSFTQYSSVQKMRKPFVNLPFK